MPARAAWWTLLAMLAFAGNSLLCRAALARTATDPAGFTLVRLVTGALVLVALAAARPRADRSAAGTGASVGPGAGPGPGPRGGNWPSALALFAYAAAFAFAYVGLPAGTGALLLFGAVQATMIAAGLRGGERLRPARVLGLALALGGLVLLVLPGVAAPPPLPAGLMVAAGVAWAAYSLRGRGGGDPLGATAGNFARSIPFALGLTALAQATHRLAFDAPGVALAVASGAVASGLGYAAWYAALRHLQATPAAIVQLSVPVIAAGGGVVFLAEPVTARLVLASIVVLSGIALAVAARSR
jgi:drug/metabolite transporter (DMT)-like permease